MLNENSSSTVIAVKCELYIYWSALHNPTPAEVGSDSRNDLQTTECGTSHTSTPLSTTRSGDKHAVILVASHDMTAISSLRVPAPLSLPSQQQDDESRC
jgi:hypothetical protein